MSSKLSMRSLIFMILIGLFSVALAGQSFAIPLNPTSYDMLNGDRGTYTYYDDSYTGAGNPLAARSPLSGGLGDLTDGVVASGSWYVSPGPYVGWMINPTITFFFGETVFLDSITLYLDDPNGRGGVYLPRSVDLAMGGNALGFSLMDPPTSGPLAITLATTGFSGDQLALTLNRRVNGSAWVFMSEVSFQGQPAILTPEPSTFLLLGAGLIGLAGYAGIRRRKKV